MFKKLLFLSFLALSTLWANAQNMCNPSFTVSYGANGNVSFTNTSTPTSTTYQEVWDFGDGFLSLINNPTHTYNVNGTYLVCIDITDTITGTYCDTCISITVTNANNSGPQPCVASFSTSITGNNVTFTAIPVNGGIIVNADWDYGDGTTDNGNIVNHTYGTQGTYYACVDLYVQDSMGTISNCTYCANVTVMGGFNCTTTANFVPGISGQTASFNNTSTCAGTATYSWNFGDGSPTSNASNPIHIYSTNGTYNVCLTTTCFVQGTTCSDSICIPVTITGSTTNCITNANFNSTVSGLGVNFFNTSNCNGSASYMWDFGDGSSTSSQINPFHTYTTAGTYTVCLTVICVDSLTNTTCIDSTCKVVPVTGGFNCTTTANFTSTSAGFNATFSNTSSCAGTATYLWKFGDGSLPSTQANPTHTYSASGTYIVCLYTTCFVQGTTCMDSICKSVQIAGNSGVNNIAKNAQHLTIYPNPVSNVAVINLPKGTSYTLVVSDVSGKIISRKETGTITNGSYNYNVSAFAKGIYTIVAQSNVTVYRASFVKE